MIKHFISFCLIVMLIAIGRWYYIRSDYRAPGTVIILNGPSAAGKSATQEAFQNLMFPDLWIATGIDRLFDQALNAWGKPIRWIEETTDAAGNNVITLHVGAKGQQAAYAMNSAIAAYAREGCNVIVDYIAYDQAWLADLQKKLHNMPTYYVAVDIPLSVLEQRETGRGTSPAGHARSHYDTVYGDIVYDLRINTNEYTPEKIAQQIRSMTQNT
jgi:chloramphenicol 3-O-phosphotransferase